MRFSVEHVILGKYHPNWPLKAFYKIRDQKLPKDDPYRMGMYTTEAAANKVCDQLNGR